MTQLNYSRSPIIGVDLSESIVTQKPQTLKQLVTTLISIFLISRYYPNLMNLIEKSVTEKIMPSNEPGPFTRRLERARQQRRENS